MQKNTQFSSLRAIMGGVFLVFGIIVGLVDCIAYGQDIAVGNSAPAAAYAIFFLAGCLCWLGEKLRRK